MTTEKVLQGIGRVEGLFDMIGPTLQAMVGNNLLEGVPNLEKVRTDYHEYLQKYHLEDNKENWLSFSYAYVCGITEGARFMLKAKELDDRNRAAYAMTRQSSPRPRRDLTNLWGLIP